LSNYKKFNFFLKKFSDFSEPKLKFSDIFGTSTDHFTSKKFKYFDYDKYFLNSNKKENFFLINFNSGGVSSDYNLDDFFLDINYTENEKNINYFSLNEELYFNENLIEFLSKGYDSENYWYNSYEFDNSYFNDNFDFFFMMMTLKIFDI
jgi:hypothetical protein